MHFDINAVLVAGKNAEKDIRWNILIKLQFVANICR